jgi:mono/diheme cytochrome c family protein/peroxiredoxin
MLPRTLILLAFSALLLLALGIHPLQSEPSKPPDLSRKIAPFSLKDPRDDRSVSFANLKEKKAIVVVFLGTECPLSNAFIPVLASMHREYADKGVALLGINANQQDTAGRVAAHARKNEVPFPVLKDMNNVVADQFGAKRTPEAFVLAADGTVLYQGRIDDQFGIGYSRPGKPSRLDLALAVDEVLAGKPVSVAKTDVAGCFIGRVSKPKSDGAVTYAKHISRIVQKNCQECHRPGQVGPMPLLTYDDAVAWADTIREVVDERRMPPWHADPRFGKFANDRSLPKEDREAILAWIAGGMPKGDDRDLPPALQFPEGWRLGKPDVVFTMPKPFEVPAETPRGGVPYQYFSIPTDFTEDKWVVRAEVHPGAADVIHHVIAFIVPKGELFRPDAPGSVLCGMAPGDMPMNLNAGFAKKIPAGARIVFQMHYTPNGKARTDQTSIGLVFAKGPPEHRILTKPVHNSKFITRQVKIPAGDGNYEIEAEHTFRADTHITAFMPHMHLRGKDFRYEATYPDGKTETLLSVPHYQFGWQTLYRCAEPLALPKGTKLRCVAHFDNSAKNPNNPDPKTDVYWGDQTWQEMMIGWIDYYLDDEKP